MADKLDKDTIARLLSEATGEAPQDIKARVEAKTDEVLARLKGWGMDVKRPKILYDLKGHTGGYAIGGHTIRLNIQVLNDPRYTEDMIEQTLPHELAHIAVHQLWPRAKGHGREWQSMMFKLGLKAERCHQYETKAARKKATPYTYYCGCGEHKVTATLHRRMQQGRMYRCRKCGRRLERG